MNRKKRVCIFAAYDKESILKSYVISYLHFIRSVCDYIVFISDCPYEKKYVNILNSLVNYHECNSHGEYDFGSYKRGLEYLISNGLINTFDELILCNDSCLCISSLSEFFYTFSEKYDFAGMTSSLEKEAHLQSFFLVFKKKIFLSDEFIKYFYSVKKEKSVSEVILNYEIPLKKFFNDLGYKDMSFLNSYPYNITRFPLLTLKNKCPLIKKKCFLNPRYSCQSLFLVFLYLYKSHKNSFFDIFDLLNVKGFCGLFFWNLRACPNFINYVYFVLKEFFLYPRK